MLARRRRPSLAAQPFKELSTRHGGMLIARARMLAMRSSNQWIRRFLMPTIVVVKSTSSKRRGKRRRRRPPLVSHRGFVGPGRASRDGLLRIAGPSHGTDRERARTETHRDRAEFRAPSASHGLGLPQQVPLVLGRRLDRRHIEQPIGGVVSMTTSPSARAWPA